MYPKIILKSHKDTRIESGHLWVFSNEIEHKDEGLAPGCFIDIYSHRKKFLGRGFYNPHSLITARILTYEDEEIDANFIAGRIENANRARAAMYPAESSYRVVFGESDLLPGLVIDKFENCYVIQSYCLGMDILMPKIIEALKKLFNVECLIKKNDSSLRHLEDLKKEVEIIDGCINLPVKIEQISGSHKIFFAVDPLLGQKTGFFFDQRDNRRRLASYCKGKKVLDCFSYTGGFGLYAAKHEASEVVSVDSSLPACDMLEKNFKLNGLTPSVMQGDAADIMSMFAKEKRQFDVIVLDPPALAKSKKNLFGAIRKYKSLNEIALSILAKDGVLASCSCSHHVGRAEFINMINDAGITAKRHLKIVEMRGQSRDHPILPSMPETEYLKCAIVKAD